MSGALNNIYPGTIINLRSRLWRVDDIQNNILSATSIQGAPVQKRRFYIPYEKIERSQISPPDPSIVGVPSAQEILTRAYRLSMIHGTAPFLGLQRSRVIPESFQMVPVVMALDMPRVRILIADDVGLGKTIEGGLIISELFAHNRASRLLVICPANLRIQWKEALYYFFHIDAKIISSNTLRSLGRSMPPGASPWEYYPYLIVSMDYAKSPRNLSHIEKNWDIVLIDEAHNLAKPHQISKNQRINKDLWTLAEKVSKSAKHLILLTATPHNGYTDTFASLLSLLEIRAVTGDIHEPIINRQVAQHHVCQRRRKDVEKDFGFTGEESPFPLRDQSETYIEPNSEEKECIERLELLQQFILDVAKDGSFQQQRLSQWTVMHLHRRALSSPESLRISLKNRLKKVNDRIKKTSAESSDEAGLTDEEARSEVLDGDPGERLSLDEAGDRFDLRKEYQKVQ